uniref:bifunctional 2-C-methyl-D-erythritol 4-phosphate cytidylyltransferase/2-C-methyl-D-erythritol 2,4-cyclodiphosphate synthase n=1 Tax=Pararhizobium sp. IMCC3301 TaxID=3067904 RepID=UPI0027423FAA|nr:bifunctional 2-C-methyl-D-erythritol 4-phosphate cytidylyltransferase/2-C-methyl-D-erythritol 2,4-cyclodiphosphate synthase [Pararhizobium sp. IMCC3301]
MAHEQPPQVAVLIVGAGKGSRASEETGELPKQFFPIDGKTLFQRTVDAFAAVPQISQIVCVIPQDTDPGLIPTCRLIENGINVLTVNGGASRQLSVLNGLEMLDRMATNWDIVLVHDAARPFVSADTIEAVIAKALTHGGCIAAVPVVDSLKQAESGTSWDEDITCVSGSIRRDGIYQAQTPQGFRFAKLLSAHKQALAEGHSDCSDDSVIYENYAGPVVIAEGDRNNWKITEPEDFATARHLLRAKREAVLVPDIRVGHGYDVHAFEAGSDVMLCGLSVPHDRSLKGHSDADVGLHALTDAVLGALADGDIGSHFPPSDPEWKAAASDRFLAFAISLAGKRGATITHLDVTLVCEAPRIGPYREPMRERIAQITGLSRDRISVKATTSERLGFTGRKEGISAFATATLVFQET